MGASSWEAALRDLVVAESPRDERLYSPPDPRLMARLRGIVPPGPVDAEHGWNTGAVADGRRRAELVERYLVARETPEKELADSGGPFFEFRLTGSDLVWLAAVDLLTSDFLATTVRSLFENRLLPSASRGDLVDWLTSAGWPGRLKMLAEMIIDRVVASTRLPRRDQTDPLPDLATLHVVEADLTRASLESGFLNGIDARGADFMGADLRRVWMKRALLNGATMSGADLSDAKLAYADLSNVVSEQLTADRTDFSGATMVSALFANASFRETILMDANLRDARLSGSALHGAVFARAQLDGCFLGSASYATSSLTDPAERGGGVAADYGPRSFGPARLLGDPLPVVRANGTTATLPPAVFQEARFGSGTMWKDVDMADKDGVTARFAGSFWNGTPIASADWSGIKKTYEEVRARRSRGARDAPEWWRLAIVASNGLSAILKEHGFDDEADQLAYRAQVCAWHAALSQGHKLRFVLGLLLGAVTGHGFKPLRAGAWYVGALAAFAVFYRLSTIVPAGPGAADRAAHHLSWLHAAAISIAAFHGRGFIPSGASLSSAGVVGAMLEAAMGLLLEVSFIVAFTQRFFHR